MVTVKDYKKRESKKGDEFYVLVLQGSVVPVKSQSTGRTYLTAKTCTVSSTFDEETCKGIIGMQFPGQIVKVETDAYAYTIPETGEVIELSHRWEYQDNTEESAAKLVVEESEVY
ncbi:hypothetical protein [Maribacter luteus]|uniref:Uncharacterized protein n=1 Tax=Maribacter luteus TaxID=2594478 RepID=A0A6I2MPF7_9FLAO|nr:hypothetical protein [Maribacter luteus]MRX64375.1 hypothetical protein [Maribacter luteus]